MAKAKNTFVSFEMEGGETVKLTLAFYLLLGLKNHRRDVYDRFNRIQVKGPQEEIDIVVVLYAAYLCAYIQEHGDDSGAMSEQDFLVGCGSDRQAVATAYKALTAPKAKTASAGLS